MVFLVVIVLLAVVVMVFTIGGGKKNKKQKNGNVHDNQLSSVQGATFSKLPVMNASENALYNFLLHMVKKYDYPVRVFPQVSLGEILKSDNKAGFFAINSKRVDFVIADKNNMPVAVVEYQGSGHWQNNARKRDTIKKLACEKAGIKYFDLPATYTGNEVKPLIDFLDFIKEKQGS